MSAHNNISVSRTASRSENGDSGTPHPKKLPSSAAGKPPQDQLTLKCPRCNSPNTKFCYYNNYSLSQPRHFCKTCRRYWTRGGALRNVPIGGGCRKTRKAVKHSNSSSSCSTTSSSSSSSRFFSTVMEDSKFFNGFVSPAMDFQLAGLSLNKIVNLNPNLSIGGSFFNENNNNDSLQLCSSSSSLGDQPTAVDGGSSGLSLMGFGEYPLTNPGFSSAGGTESSVAGVDGNIASSIQTLSSLNQDLHWKLQQQRMAMIFGSKEGDAAVSNSPPPMERPQPILFQNLEINNSSSRKDDSGGGEAASTSTEWYFGNSGYAPNNNNNPVGISHSTTNDWHGVHQAAAWADLNQYNALP